MRELFHTSEEISRLEFMLNTLVDDVQYHVTLGERGKLIVYKDGILVESSREFDAIRSQLRNAHFNFEFDGYVYTDRYDALSSLVASREYHISSYEDIDYLSWLLDLKKASLSQCIKVLGQFGSVVVYDDRCGFSEVGAQSSSSFISEGINSEIFV